MSKDTAGVTAVVVNYHSADDVLALLTRLHGQLTAAVIVDNSDGDDDWQKLTNALGVDATTTLVKSPSNVGFAAAVNVALGRATTPYVLLLNPDLLDVPDVRRLVASATATNAAVVAPQVLDDSGLRVKGTYGGAPTVPTFVRYALCLPGRRTRSLMAAPPRRTDPVDVGWVSGACCLVDVAAWRSTPFDESLFMYAEDIDFCWRQRHAGNRVVLDPAVTVRHRAGGSSGGRPPLGWARNLALVMERRHRGARFLLGAGLLSRSAAARVLGHRDHAGYLRASARSALHSRDPSPAPANPPSGRQWPR